MKRISAVLIAVLFVALSVEAKVDLPSVFGDNMVL